MRKLLVGMLIWVTSFTVVMYLGYSVNILLVGYCLGLFNAFILSRRG